MNWKNRRKLTPYQFKFITKKMRNEAEQWNKRKILEEVDMLICELIKKSTD